MIGRRNLAARVLAGGALVIAALSMWAAGEKRAAGAVDETITTTLHPGWNLVGWIHEETGAGAIFDELPGLTAILDGADRALSADGGSGNGSSGGDVLQPGRGYWFRLEGDAPLEWRRSAQSAVRRFELEPGSQLVAWAGPNGRSVDDVLLGLRGHVAAAWRWVAAEQRYARWSPDGELPGRPPPPLDRGEALWVVVTDAVAWLHPSGELPAIEFVGGLSAGLAEDLRGVIEADLRFVIERFAARFQFEAPSERLRVQITTTPEAAREQSGLLSCGLHGCAHSPQTFGGRSTIVLPLYKWLSYRTAAADLPTAGRVDLAHEYFHVLQYEWAGPLRRQAPGWLVEGAAIWAGRMVFDEPAPSFGLSQVGTNELNLTSRAHPQDYDHALGTAATALLARRAGSQSLVEFWRELGWQARLGGSWESAFAQAFGLTIAEFEREFQEVREPMFAVVRGRVVSPSAAAQIPLQIRAQGFSSVFGAAFSTAVLSDRTFSLRLARRAGPEGGALLYKAAIARIGSSCAADIAPDGTTSWPEPGNISEELLLRPGAEPTEDFFVLVSESFCQRELEVRLEGGAAARATVLFCRPGESHCVFPARQTEGVFRDFVPYEGRYIIRVLDDETRCAAFASAAGFTADRADARQVRVGDEPTAVRLRLNSVAELCAPGS